MTIIEWENMIRSDMKRRRRTEKIIEVLGWLWCLFGIGSLIYFFYLALTS